MKKKVLVIVVILVAAAVCAGITVPMAMKGKGGNNADKNAESALSEEAGSSAQESGKLPAGSDSSVDTAEAGQESDASSSSGGGGFLSGLRGSKGSSGKSDGKQSQSAANGKNSSENDSSIPEISFPYEISGTDLVVEQIRSYSGYFIEDGSDKDVSGVAAIVLKNNGGDLTFAGIGISQGSRSLAFSASQIPAGATVVILEQNGSSFSSSDPYYSATATTTPVDSFEMSEDLVSVEDNGNNGLTVTNISDQTLSEVKILFKNYLKDDDAYVGGITYTITLNDMEAGASTDVSASHYDSEYSKVVGVQAK